MSMFEDLLKSALGGEPSAAQNQTQNLLQGLLNVVNNAGGVQGIMNRFRQSGLGDVVESWVGTGENKPISGEQLASVLGRDKVDALARQAGIPVAKGANALAEMFPALVDKLTPDGVLPDKSQLMTIGKVILGGLGVAAATAAAAVFRKKGEEETAAEEAVPASSVGTESAGTAGRSYTVVSGDTLSKIAKQFYGDANQWNRIFDANRNVLDDPNRIFPGQVLQIP